MAFVQQGFLVLCTISCLLAAATPDPEDDLSVIGLRYESLLKSTVSPSVGGSVIIVEPQEDPGRFQPSFLLTRWFHNRAGERIYYEKRDD